MTIVRKVEAIFRLRTRVFLRVRPMEKECLIGFTFTLQLTELFGQLKGKECRKCVYYKREANLFESNKIGIFSTDTKGWVFGKFNFIEFSPFRSFGKIDSWRGIGVPDTISFYVFVIYNLQFVFVCAVISFRLIIYRTIYDHILYIQRKRERKSY